MGTRLKTQKGANLYDFWGASLAEYLNQQLEDLARAKKGAKDRPVVVNLASNEYFKAVDLKALKARVVQCVFQDYKNGAWKIISFHAKKARGLMARYVVDHKINKVEALQGFNSEGYAFEASASTAEKLVFRRPERP
jgi:cytoplasmic iron level regulating protein YaaA (DUF328/UPF0246 family)